MARGAVSQRRLRRFSPLFRRSRWTRSRAFWARTSPCVASRPCARLRRGGGEPGDCACPLRRSFRRIAHVRPLALRARHAAAPAVSLLPHLEFGATANLARSDPYCRAGPGRDILRRSTRLAGGAGRCAGRGPVPRTRTWFTRRTCRKRLKREGLALLVDRLLAPHGAERIVSEPLERMSRIRSMLTGLVR